MNQRPTSPNIWALYDSSDYRYLSFHSTEELAEAALKSYEERHPNYARFFSVEKVEVDE